jgi:hypothetical protein
MLAALGAFGSGIDHDAAADFALFSLESRSQGGAGQGESAIFFCRLPYLQSPHGVIPIRAFLSGIDRPRIRT